MKIISFSGMCPTGILFCLIRKSNEMNLLFSFLITFPKMRGPYFCHLYCCEERESEIFSNVNGRKQRISRGYGGFCVNQWAIDAQI